MDKNKTKQMYEKIVKNIQNIIDNGEYHPAEKYFQIGDRRPKHFFRRPHGPQDYRG